MGKASQPRVRLTYACMMHKSARFTVGSPVEGVCVGPRAIMANTEFGHNVTLFDIFGVRAAHTLIILNYLEWDS